MELLKNQKLYYLNNLMKEEMILMENSNLMTLPLSLIKINSQPLCLSIKKPQKKFLEIITHVYSSLLDPMKAVMLLDKP